MRSTRRLGKYKRLRHATRCPHCDHELSALASAGPGLKPDPGDYAVCEHCLHIGRFDDGMKLEAIDWLDVAPECLADVLEVRAEIAARADAPLAIS